MKYILNNLVDPYVRVIMVFTLGNLNVGYSNDKEMHYSIFKAAKYYIMDSKSVHTLPMSKIDYDALEAEISRNLDKPVIINVNIGTTVKRAVDNLDHILRILHTLGIPREYFHIYCDGALFAMMMPFVDYAHKVSFQNLLTPSLYIDIKCLGVLCHVVLPSPENNMLRK